MNRILPSLCIAFSLFCFGCEQRSGKSKPSASSPAAKSDSHAGHDHGDDDHGHAATGRKDDHSAADGHDHSGHADESGGHGDVVFLGLVTIGDMGVTLAQGHGPIEAGAESHLVAKLPHADGGATIVRAWIGTDDRSASLVGRGDYDADTDEYHVHATSPDPLPKDVMWWIEIEKPDGTTVVGSTKPILK